MYRNTFFLLILLAITAGVLVAFNLTHRSNPPSSIAPSPTPTPTVKNIAYQLVSCGISFFYPNTHTILEGPGTSVVLTPKTGSSDSIIITCQKSVPRPLLAPEKIEKISMGSASGTLYHDVSAKDGTPMDKLIFRHPTNGLDIFVSGTGPTLQRIITSIVVL